MNRLAVYFFYDKGGCIRKYNLYYLESLKKIANTVIFVSNGELQKDSYIKVSSVADKILIRVNVGFDVWAYKEALEFVGWNEVIKFDELILCNFTCYGPVYPFKEMFDVMSARKNDFWGVAKHPEQKNYLLPNKQGWIFEHIMSYFMVIRHNMLNNPNFKSYWDNIPPIKTKTESTAFHETVFTKHFESLGFVSDSFVDLEKYKGRANNSSIFYADKFLKEDRCPLVKRRAFFFPPYGDILNASDGRQAKELMEFITHNTDYDENMIWDDILSTQPLSLIMNNMHLNEISSIDHRFDFQRNDALFVFSVKFGYQVDILKKYLPKTASDCVFIIYKSDYLRNVEENWPDAHLICVAQDQPFLIELSNIKSECKYICCVDTKDVKRNNLQITSENYFEEICSNLLSSADVLSFFDKNPRLGLFISAPASFGGYYAYAYARSNSRESYFENIFQNLGLNVCFDKDSLTTDFVFWCRFDVLKRIFRFLEKVPKQSLDEIYASLMPMFFQSEGYYSSLLQSSETAKHNLSNMMWMERQLNDVMYSKYKKLIWYFAGIKNYISSLGNSNSNKAVHSVAARAAEPKMTDKEPFKCRLYKALHSLHLISDEIYKAETAKYTDDYKILAGSKLFDAKWYLKQYHDVAVKKADPVLHYIRHGWKEGRDPSEQFSGNRYLAIYKDVRAANKNPLIHYERYGKREGRVVISSKDYLLVARSELFDARWYLEQYPDVAAQKVDPVLHYMVYGWKEGRKPCAKFDGNIYLSGIKRRDICPLLHYEKNGEQGVFVHSSTLRYIGIKDDRIELFLITSKSYNKIYLQSGIYKYHPVTEISNAQEELLQYLLNYNSIGYWFEIPADKVLNEVITIRENGYICHKIQWTGDISYGAFDLKKRGLYARIYNGKYLFIENWLHFNWSVITSGGYSFKEKILYLLMKLNPVHRYILFAENGGAGDNSFELFKYAVQRNHNCYYLASNQVISGIADPFLRKHLIEFGSNRHLFMFICSRLWITSFSLRYELFPQNKKLKDIHYYNIPAEWIFCPHGITGDRKSSMVNKYSWDSPSRTYCCNEYEQNFFSDVYGFRNVFGLGDCRMDKWADADLDENKIILFFTWRIAFRTQKSKEIIKDGIYVKTILAIVKMIHEKFPQKSLYYVFHHEVVKAGVDKIIKELLGNNGIQYIYFNNTDGIKEFNTQFKSAKYLVTDYSSCAYDFAYKNGSIPIYYLNDTFISGHYPLEKRFYDIHLGTIAKTVDDLEKALRMQDPTKAMKKRRERFFAHLDGKNCERVYNEIFKSK